MSDPEPEVPKLRADQIDEWVRGIFQDLTKPCVADVYRQILGEREGGPMRFESTPGDGPNPYYKKFFEAE
jgi:hypothetical protein